MQINRVEEREAGLDEEDAEKMKRNILYFQIQQEIEDIGQNLRAALLSRKCTKHSS